MPKTQDAKKEDKEPKETQLDQGTEIVVDDQFIDQAVEHINEIANKTTYSGMMEIGQYVLEKFFDNDIEKASSRNPRKPESYKKLTEREDLVVPLSSLSIAVRVAGQEKFLEDKKINIDKLTYTHKAELVRMGNDIKKTSLVKKCIEENWTTRKLSEEVRKKIKKEDSETELPGRVNIRYLESMAKQIDKYSLVSDSDTLKKMNKKSREKIKEKARVAMEKMQMKISECEDILDAIKGIEEDGDSQAN